MRGYFEIIDGMTSINLKKYKVLLIGIIIALSAFTYGIYIGQHQSSRSEASLVNLDNATSSITSVDMAPFWAVWKTLNDKFVYTHKNAKVINDQDKLWGAIQGLTNSYGDH